MTPEDPSFAALVSSSSTVGAMVWLALKHRLLEIRPPRRCPACGRTTRAHAPCACRT